MTDGGEPGDSEADASEATDDRSAEGQSTGGQATGGQNWATGGQAQNQATGGQISQGQSQGDHQAQNQATDGQPPQGKHTGTGQAQHGGHQQGQAPQGQQPAGGHATGGGAGQGAGGQAPGGQATGGQARGERPADGQTRGGRPADVQTRGGRPAGGQTRGGQPSGGQPGGYGNVPGGYGGGFDAGAFVAALPLRAGAAIGALAALLPYVLITLGAYVPLQRDHFTITADLYATFVGFGPGREFVATLIGGTDISSLANVQPADYPSVEAELDAVLGTLRSQPESLLLPLYILVPLLSYFGGRWMARKYATGDSIVERTRVALALPLGALPVVLAVSVAFSVQDVSGPVLFGGLLVPLLFGALGGLTAFAFDGFTWGASKFYGWLAALVGMVVAVVLVPIPAMGALGIEFVHRALYGLMGYLATVSFGIGGGAQGFVMFLLIALLVVLAGFVRVYRSRHHVRTPIEGARLGASVVLGFLAAVAILLVFVPFLSLVIDLPFGMDAAFGAVMPDVARFTRTILGAAIFGLLFGAGGGALRVWQRDRNRPPAQGRRPQQRPRR